MPIRHSYHRPAQHAADSAGRPRHRDSANRPRRRRFHREAQSPSAARLPSRMRALTRSLPVAHPLAAAERVAAPQSMIYKPLAMDAMG